MPISELVQRAINRSTRVAGAAVADDVERTTVKDAARKMAGDALKLSPKAAKAAVDHDAAAKAVGFTDHFREWLDKNGYARFNFARPDLPGGAFGGKANAAEKLTHRPLILIHGNTDAALGTEHPRHSGWDATIRHFLSKGYKPSEIYAFSWGEDDMGKALSQRHSKENVLAVRNFIQAVLEYTGAAQVDVEGHSMGETLARKAIKGGKAIDAMSGAYDVGKPLTERVDTFVGIAGANQGLTSAYMTGGALPVMNPVDGFYPGVLPGFGQSQFLRELNSNPAREGQHVYSIYSKADEVLGPGNLVWGQRTSRIPGQDGEKVLENAGHIASKDETVAAQYAMITRHAVPN